MIYALNLIMFVVSFCFLFYLLVTEDERYRGLCAHYLDSQPFGVLSLAPVSSSCYALYWLFLVLGFMEHPLGSLLILGTALGGARAAFLFPAHILDFGDRIHAWANGHPVEMPVRRMVNTPSEDLPFGVRDIRRSLTDIWTLPSVWEARYRARRVDALKDLVDRETDLLRACEQHARQKREHSR